MTERASFEVLRAALPKIQVCWDCLTLEMKAVCSVETLASDTSHNIFIFDNIAVRI